MKRSVFNNGIQSLVVMGIVAMVVFLPVHVQSNDTERDRTLIQQILYALFGVGEGEITNEQYEQIKEDPERLEAILSGTPSEINDASGRTSGYEYDGLIPVPDDEISFVDEYGLPQPDESDAQELLGTVKNNDDQLWMLDRLIEAGAYLTNEKGHEVPIYLRIGWLWFENTGVPDVYSINCNESRAKSQVSEFCNSTNFQIAGYQASDRQNDYAKAYEVCYGDQDPTVIAERVVANSDRASRPEWSYNDTSQIGVGLMEYKDDLDTLTIGQIAPNRDFFSDESTQFYTLVLGKDPCLVMYLNSAVNERFINQLRAAGDGNELYDYIGDLQKKMIANRTYAAMLRAEELNQRRLENPGDDDSGRNNTGNRLEMGSYVQYCQCDARWGGVGSANCNAGCGPTTMASILTTLGSFYTPNDIRSYWQGRGWWNAGEGTYPGSVMQSGWLESIGYSISPVKLEVIKGFNAQGQQTFTKQLDADDARRFFTGANKDQCLIFASNEAMYHIFYIRGVNPDGSIIVQDSWKGCTPNGDGTYSENTAFQNQPASYVTKYAYAICKNE